MPTCSITFHTSTGPPGGSRKWRHCRSRLAKRPVELREAAGEACAARRVVKVRQMRAVHELDQFVCLLHLRLDGGAATLRAMNVPQQIAALEQRRDAVRSVRRKIFERGCVARRKVRVADRHGLIDAAREARRRRWRRCSARVWHRRVREFRCRKHRVFLPQLLAACRLRSRPAKI